MLTVDELNVKESVLCEALAPAGRVRINAMASLMEISPLDGLLMDVPVADVVALLLEPGPLPDAVLLLVLFKAPPPPKVYAP